MLRKRGYAGVLLLSLFALLGGIPASAQTQSTTPTVSLLTRHSREVTSNGQASFVGRLPSTATMQLDIVLPLRDQAGLNAFLQQVYDPSSTNYRRFLTVQEFTARFGPTQQDYDAVVRFAQANGFTVVGGSRDGMDVQVKGSVAAIEAAFHVNMGAYQHPTENRTFYAPDREPTTSLPVPIWHISGLENYSIPRPRIHQKDLKVQSNATSGSCPSTSFCGSDMRAAYYGGTTLTGAGQNIGLLEFVGYDVSDLSTYYQNAGQPMPAATITGISTDGTSLSCLAQNSCDDTEQILDMTQALGMAPGISTLYVFVGSTDTAILSSMTTTSPLALELSCSWAWKPADPGSDDPYFQRMAAQGQSFFAAAGDSAEWTVNNFAYPAEDPNVIAVGGTSLTTSSPGGAWSAETGWPDSGGGISPDALPIPSWQQLNGVISSSNGGSTVYRNGPDVSANSDFTFFVCANQTTCSANVYGGTSFAAPMWAGFIALANQQAAANGASAVGFMNPAIYQLGLSSAYGNDLHDITIGSNGFSAVTGYDLQTGWGSPNGVNLINALTQTVGASDFAITASPSSVSVMQGKVGGTSVSTTISGGFDAAVALTASGQPAGVTVSFNPSSIAAPGLGTATMNLALASTTATGTYPITVTGTGGSVTHTTTVTLTVLPIPPTLKSIAVTPANPSAAAGTTVQFKATGTYSDNSTKDLTASSVWTSSNTSFASISASSGLATAIAAGGTTITATSVGIPGSTTLTVTASTGQMIHDASPTPQGLQNFCVTPLLVASSDGGGTLTICNWQNAQGQPGTITWKDATGAVRKQYSDLQTTHYPTTRAPYFTFVFNGNRSSSTQNGYYRYAFFVTNGVVHFN